jgi:hypothetical protein
MCPMDKVRSLPTLVAQNSILWYYEITPYTVLRSLLAPLRITPLEGHSFFWNIAWQSLLMSNLHRPSFFKTSEVRRYIDSAQTAAVHWSPLTALTEAHLPGPIVFGPFPSTRLPSSVYSAPCDRMSGCESF